MLTQTLTHMHTHYTLNTDHPCHDNMPNLMLCGHAFTKDHTIQAPTRIYILCIFMHQPKHEPPRASAQGHARTPAKARATARKRTRPHKAPAHVGAHACQDALQPNRGWNMQGP